MRSVDPYRLAQVLASGDRCADVDVLAHGTVIRLTLSSGDTYIWSIREMERLCIGGREGELLSDRFLYGSAAAERGAML